MRDLIEEYAEKRAHQKTIEFARNLIMEGMSEDFVVRTTKLPLEEVQKLAEKRSA